MEYLIIIATLGYYDDIGYHTVPRTDYSTNMLKYNMSNLWAWNISGQFDFESDGPCCFIQYTGADH